MCFEEKPCSVTAALNKSADFCSRGLHFQVRWDLRNKANAEAPMLTASVTAFFNPPDIDVWAPTNFISHFVVTSEDLTFFSSDFLRGLTTRFVLLAGRACLAERSSKSSASLAGRFAFLGMSPKFTTSTINLLSSTFCRDIIIVINYFYFLFIWQGLGRVLVPRSGERNDQICDATIRSQTLRSCALVLAKNNSTCTCTWSDGI